MASPWKLMGKYWNNPTAVLDALEINAWPPEDDADESVHRGHHQQHRPAQAAVRGDAPASVASNGTRPNGAAYARSLSDGHRHQQQQRPRPTAGRPRAKPWLIPQEAAVRIQSAYRGHRARKGVRRVRDLEAEVEAVERRIMASLDDLLRDGRERARTNEMIMDVLVRLDGVGGGCREYRKMVIRKAISLQESLDCLVGEELRGGERTDGRGDVTQAKQLGEEDQDQSSSKLGKGVDRSGDEGPEQGSGSRDDEVEDLDEEEDEEEGSRRSGCGGLREALGRVMEENTMLRGMVQNLLHRNEEQSQMMTRLSQEVEDLKSKLQSLGRKRRRSSKGGGTAGRGASSSSSSSSPSSLFSDGEEAGRRSPSFSSSSSLSSGEEGDHDEQKDCARGDGDRKMVTGHHDRDRDDGRCER